MTFLTITIFPGLFPIKHVILLSADVQHFAYLMLNDILGNHKTMSTPKNGTGTGWSHYKTNEKTHQLELTGNSYKTEYEFSGYLNLEHYSYKMWNPANLYYSMFCSSIFQKYAR